MIADLIDDLRVHIGELHTDFLSPFLPPDPLHRPRDYDHKVKAACVLAHAAFEEFVEKVSLHVMAIAIAKWQMERKASDSLLALCLRHGVSIVVEDDEDKLQSTCFDQLRLALDEAKKRHSKSIQDNHGFSIKYLRAALTPVFINPPSDLRLIESLKTLAAARGSFAHSAARNAEFSSGPRARARSTLSPEDAWNAITDCLTLCAEIADSAVKLIDPGVRPARVPLRRKLELRRADVKERLPRLARRAI